MDVLTLILRTVRASIEATGAPPDAIQDALADAEARLRRDYGGATHHISRVQQPTTKAQILDLAAAGRTPQQISAVLGVTDRYVRQVLAAVR